MILARPPAPEPIVASILFLSVARLPEELFCSQEIEFLGMTPMLRAALDLAIDDRKGELDQEYQDRALALMWLYMVRRAWGHWSDMAIEPPSYFARVSRAEEDLSGWPAAAAVPTAQPQRANIRGFSSRWPAGSSRVPWDPRPVRRPPSHRSRPRRVHE